MAKEKLDLTKEYKTYYTAKTWPHIVEFGEARFIGIEGKGEPGGEEFSSRVGALYPLAYAIKNLSKKDGRDFGVAKLEGLWWVEQKGPFLEVPRSEWCWKLLIRLPDSITAEVVEKARQEVLKKKGIELVKAIAFEKITEGKCVQIMHLGPYATEDETIMKMKAFMDENDLVENGLHHELYLSDPHKSAPEKMKTILRQPVKSK